ncbi:hypothetical protein RND81_07G019100 [Saponaria officinalis]|uniref:Transmembrane protein n=1 Tax=Saponaria officinalis TaxID=3572 RepID=A0AAW1JMR8_SAPOF
MNFKYLTKIFIILVILLSFDNTFIQEGNCRVLKHNFSVDVKDIKRVKMEAQLLLGVKPKGPPDQSGPNCSTFNPTGCK